MNKFDERFTSKIARQTIVSSGINKKNRRKKELVDKISATIILQDYLCQNRYLHFCFEVFSSN